MGRHWALGLVVAFIGSTVVLACVGEDASATREGALDGACFANGTCNVGLVCTGGTCRASDGGATAETGTASDGGTTDSAPPDATARAACEGGVPDVSDELVECSGPLTCQRGITTCCVSAGDGRCINNGAETCTSAERMFQCASGSNCADPSPCCLDALNLSATCPLTARLAATACKPTCGADLEVCAPGWTCTDARKHCEVLELTDPVVRVIGVCVN